VMVCEAGPNWSRAASGGSRRCRGCARTAFCFDVRRSNNYGAHDSSDRCCNGGLVFYDRLSLDGTVNINPISWQRRPLHQHRSIDVCVTGGQSSSLWPCCDASRTESVTRKEGTHPGAPALSQRLVYVL